MNVGSKEWKERELKLINSSLELLKLRHDQHKRWMKELDRGCDWAQHHGYSLIKDTLNEYKETLERAVIYSKPYRPKPVLGKGQKLAKSWTKD